MNHEDTVLLSDIKPADKPDMTHVRKKVKPPFSMSIIEIIPYFIMGGSIVILAVYLMLK